MGLKVGRAFSALLVMGLWSVLIWIGSGVGNRAHAAIIYVQGSYSTSSGSTSSNIASASYPSAQATGDLNVVIVAWGDSTSAVQSVIDSKGNTYVAAVGPTRVSGNGSQSIYYAKNITSASANDNIVTVTFNTTVQYVDLRVAEYSGVDTSNPLDVAVGASGTGTAQNSGSVTTTTANDVLVAGNYLGDSTTAVGAGYTQRINTNYSEIVEDEIVSAIGSYNATSTQGSSNWWVIQLAAFRAASSGDTTPPSAPTSLTGTVASAAQINLSWTASTDNVAVTGYRVEDCSGASCTTFAQIGTPTSTTYSATGLTASTAYSFRVRATDAAGNLSTYSITAKATTSAAADTTAPTAPSGLTAAVASAAQINLSWTASTDNVGVTGYKVESCSGVSCTTFAQIGTPTATNFSATGLAASTAYSFRVRATDAAGNLSAYSSTASGTTTATTAISYVQGASQNPSTGNSLAATFSAAQAAGDLNVVVVGWADSTTTVSSITDTKGNTYAPAGAAVSISGTATQRIYYATSIVAAAAGANTVAVTLSANTSWPELKIAEYRGISATSPLDAEVGASGTTSASPNSGSLTTTSANDLLVGSNYADDEVSAPGSGYTQRYQTAGGEILEDKTVSAIGSYSAGVTLTGSSWWVIQLAAFRGTSGNSDTTPPSAPTGLTASIASATQINLSWTASTDNVGVTGYRIESCSGTSCTTFAQIGTSTTTIYSATGLIASTAYSFRIRATDAAGNLSAYSSTTSGTTSASGDTTPPSAPSSFVPSVVSSTQITLRWTASTDNVGVTGYRIERCSGASCTTFAQIGTSTATSYSDTGLTASTSYSYRARATDAAGNLSAYSSTASATTQAVADTFPPTAPTSLSPSVTSATQIHLTWAASTDDVGVIGYRVERCQGAGCSSFSQIGMPTATTYSDTGLTASTNYSYRVRATDAAGNLSGYSNTVSATTTSGINNYTYDANGRLSSIGTSSGTVHYTYDAAGHVTNIGLGP